MLTDAQIQAVECDSRECVVIAGAGAGKTTVMARRVVRLIQNGAGPSQILAISFTRAAARNLRERIGSLTEARIASKVDCRTFHSLGLRCLQVYGDRLGYDPASLTVIDPDDTETVIKQAARDMGYLANKHWKSGLSLSKVQAALEQCYHDAEIPATEENDAAARIINRYWLELRRMNCLDFGLILAETNRLFRNHADVLDRFRLQYPHILCDELQDTDTCQFNLHDWFSPPGTFYGVGDFRQSIYGWRGARPSLWRERRPSAAVLSIPDCFRCRSAIVDVANRLIQHNPEGRECEPMRAVKSGGAVGVFNGRSHNIAGRLMLDMESYGWSPRDCAVIARSRAELKRLSFVFDEHGIPHRHVGRKFDITKSEQFREVHAAMRLALNPRDDLAFMRLIDRMGITPAMMTTIRREAAATGTALWPAAMSLGESSGSQLGMSLAYEPENPTLSEMMLRLHDVFDPVHPDILRFWEEDCAGLSLAEALAWFAERDEQTDVPTAEENLVSLLTVHAAKGLEFPVVIVAGLNEGTFPNRRDVATPEREQEARRCAYVAFTRASDMLLLHYRRAEDQADERGISPPSRFLYESGVPAIPPATNAATEPIEF